MPAQPQLRCSDCQKPSGFRQPVWQALCFIERVCVIALFLIFILLYVTFATVAYIYAKKRGAIYWSDLVLPIVVIGGWIAVTVSGYGHQSLSHVVEVPIALLFALVAFNLRVFVADKFMPIYKLNSYVVLALSILFVLLLRTFMPFLPE